MCHRIGGELHMHDVKWVLLVQASRMERHGRAYRRTAFREHRARVNRLAREIQVRSRSAFRDSIDETDFVLKRPGQFEHIALNATKIAVGETLEGKYADK